MLFFSVLLVKDKQHCGSACYQRYQLWCSYDGKACQISRLLCPSGIFLVYLVHLKLALVTFWVILNLLFLCLEQMGIFTFDLVRMIRGPWWILGGKKKNPCWPQNEEILSQPGSQWTKLSVTQAVRGHCGHTNLSSDSFAGRSQPFIILCASFNKNPEVWISVWTNKYDIHPQVHSHYSLVLCVPHSNALLQLRGGKLCVQWKVQNNSTPASVLLKSHP